MATERTCSDGDQAVELIEIVVNEQAVTLPAGRVTGKDIKQAAIDCRVSIDESFVLSIEDEPRETRVIADLEVVEICTGTRLVAIPDDDNS